MDVAALIVSIVAVVISALVAVRQYLSSRQERRLRVWVDARSTTYVSPDGERIPVVGVRVKNGNPKYPIRVHSVAFTDPSASEAQVWVSREATVAPYDAEIIDLPIDQFDETRELFSETFTAWVELTTGDIFRSDPHPAPAD
jgi:hypothetical protein